MLEKLTISLNRYKFLLLSVFRPVICLFISFTFAEMIPNSWACLHPKNLEVTWEQGLLMSNLVTVLFLSIILRSVSAMLVVLEHPISLQYCVGYPYLLDWRVAATFDFLLGCICLPLCPVWSWLCGLQISFLYI